jgi:HEAT repeats/Bacterial SH3 domain
MEEQDQQIEEQSNGDGAAQKPPRTEETQVGQVLQSLSKATRQLATPTPAPNKRAVAQAASTALRERIGSLIAALGDPSHPLHHQAVDDLMAIGVPAVPALNDALNPNRPWLTAYRAAEALGQIGDGRAAGPLLDALRHPNSNVRWSAVRALAVVGDARALLELRRVARDDQGKTSWGESVGGAAQSVLDQMQSRNMLLRGADLIKTAVACVLMLVALILAWSVINTLRTELRQVGRETVPAEVAEQVATALPTLESAQELTQETAVPEPTAVPTAAPTNLITGTVLTTGNVRALPTTKGARVGGVTEGDEVIFLAATSDGNWYKVQLGERHAATSQINSSDGAGWVNQSLLSEPGGDLPTEQPPTPSPGSAPPTATP